MCFFLSMQLPIIFNRFSTVFIDLSGAITLPNTELQSVKELLFSTDFFPDTPSGVNYFSFFLVFRWFQFVISSFHGRWPFKGRCRNRPKPARVMSRCSPAEP